MATAGDGSLWFIENGDSKAWIARLSADGHYAHWPAPELPGDYAHLAAGPDGTMWFTGTDAIWQIDSSGRMTRVALGDGLIPHYAVSVDGALWFTTDMCVGRVSTRARSRPGRSPAHCNSRASPRARTARSRSPITTRTR